MTKMRTLVVICAVAFLLFGAQALASATGASVWWGPIHSHPDYSGGGIVVEQIVVKVGGVNVPCILAGDGSAISCDWSDRRPYHG